MEKGTTQIDELTWEDENCYQITILKKKFVFPLYDLC